MSLSIDEKKAIIAYRIQKAKATMIEAQDNAKLGHWNLVSNRLYYAAFHWTEEDVIPLMDRTEQLIEKIEKLISLKDG